MDVLIGTPVKLYPLSLLRLYSVSDRPLEFTQDRYPLTPSLSKDEKCLPGSIINNWFYILDPLERRLNK